MTDLGLPGGDSAALGINNNGQILGYSSNASYEWFAFLYNPQFPDPSVLFLLLGSD
jgi:probable HAF family extracellular repeat protein